MLAGVILPILVYAFRLRRLTWIVRMFRIGGFRCWPQTPTILTEMMMGSGVRVRLPRSQSPFYSEYAGQPPNRTA
jgi:hypothetical protein